MNYLAHARLVLGDPYETAGVAAPDWMNVVARRSKLRRVELWEDEDDRLGSAFVRGVKRHHADDAWFHRTRAFVETTYALTVDVRDTAPSDRGMRASFVGHVLVELLLDAELMRRDATLADRFYETLSRVEPALVQRYAQTIAAKPFSGLDRFLPRFLTERFLYDYAEDARLLWRMNRVLQRVGLDPLPEATTAVIAQWRPRIADHADALMTPES